MAGRKAQANGRATRADKHVRRIADLLEREYLPKHPKAKMDVYRYNSACIRIRVMDPGFRGTDLADRDPPLWTILDSLPDETFTQISLLLLLTPKEAKTSGVNVEFEDPTPSPP
jgi:hypothetical protein